MAFQSFSFLAFLALTLALCLPVGRRNRRAGELPVLAASLVFYLWKPTAQVWGGFAVLAFSAGLTWFAAPFLRPGRPRRRAVFTAAVCWHVLVLLAFKYTGFFTGGRLSIGWAPLGLSFFTFQQLWLLKEVYTGEYPESALRELSAGDYALFAFFFPTVSSGPILRPGSFFPQLKGERFLRPTGQDAAAGFYAIALGMAKKVLLADSFGAIVDNGYAQAAGLSVPGAWLVILGYTLQLYFDFSGYCDVAAGIARLLGLRLPVNFDSPYRALSLGDFWKRWHITLTTFLRECVYFPLGGSRKGTARTYGNILTIFLISGFWHGAGWTFLLWGALHGVGQITERILGPRRERLPKALRWGLTFLFVNLAWVFFRAPTVPAALGVLRAAVLGGAALPAETLFAGLLDNELKALALLLPGAAQSRYALVCLVLYGAGLTAVLTPGNTIRRMDTFRPALWRAAAASLLLAWSILSFTGITSFIYSNF